MSRMFGETIDRDWFCGVNDDFLTNANGVEGAGDATGVGVVLCSRRDGLASGAAQAPDTAPMANAEQGLVKLRSPTKNTANKQHTMLKEYVYQ